MTTTPPDAPVDPAVGPEPPPDDAGPRATAAEIRDLGKLRRTVGPDRKIAGVAGGLARHLDIDPVILRVAFVVLVFFGGAGLLVYGACWLLVPEEGSDRAPLALDERSRSVALIVVGVLATLALLGDTLGGVDFPWPLAVVALITLLVLAFVDRDRRPRPTAPPVPHQPVPGTTEFVPAPGYVAAAPAAPVSPGAQAAPVAYQPTPTQTWTTVRGSRPRKRGPILFWFTMALAALGVGVLGIVDVAGADVADGAYPALVAAICGVMLLVGAFYGRAGGLILVGLLAAVGMTGAAAADHYDESTERHPATAAAVESRYEIGAGELILDLTDVSDPESLDGRTIDMEAGAGRIEVVVPEGMNVTAHARAGLGDISLFGEHQDGGGIELTQNQFGGIDAPSLRLDLQVGLGEVDVFVEGGEGDNR
jgi:phage shock protein PspC (stress-responsive transcriptional regulator)